MFSFISFADAIQKQVALNLFSSQNIQVIPEPLTE